jgi:hypothetical protein
MNARTVWMASDGRHRMRETDIHGRTREVVLDDRQTQSARRSAKPWGDPAKVTIEQFSSWTPQQQYAFATEHRDLMEGLKYAAESEDARSGALWQ